MTRRLLLTVDVDRDVNIETDSGAAAGSLDRGQGTAPRFSSSEKGLGILLDLLDEMGIKATFFVEGRTAETIDCSGISGHCIGFHGYDHENLPKVADPGRVMDMGYQAVADRIGRPVCFRAPYMSIDHRVYLELRRLGVAHDSSVYSDPGKAPYTIDGITEHPVFKGRDGSGRTIAAYLWPMHEGKRAPGDYLELARGSGDTDLILATHSWHMAERRDSGPMSEKEIQQNHDNVWEVLSTIINEGYEPSTLL